MTINESSSQFAVEYRLLMGPPWRRNVDSDFYDWSVLTLGNDLVSPVDTLVATTLTAGTTSLVLEDASTYPTKGGCWISGNGATEEWEYVTYTGKTGNTLSGLTRDAVTDEQTGVHTAGAKVKFWYEIDGVDNYEISEEMDDNLASTYWTIRMRGAHFAKHAMRNKHLAIILGRWMDGPGAVWGSWGIEYIGWLFDPKAKEDIAQSGEWDATIVSLRGILNTIHITGIRVGPVNLAEKGQATATTPLAKWYKEAHSDEFPVAANTTFEASRAIDGNKSTLYISEHFLSGSNMPANATTYGIDQIHVTYYTGQGKGYRWFQLMGPSGNYPKLHNINKVYPDINTDMSASITIVCENLARFNDENPAVDTSETTVIELSNNVPYVPGTVASMWQDTTSGGFGTTRISVGAACTLADWWDTFSASRGALHFRSSCTASASSTVVWGPLNATILGATYDWPTTVWSGCGVTAPSSGQTIRRDWDAGVATSANGYTVDYVSSPGYYLGNPNRWQDTQFYLQAEMPSLGLTLANQITDACPGLGGSLYINVGEDGCVDGLNVSGSCQIDNEQFTYSAKTDANDGVVITARGVNSTTAASHKADTQVYVVEYGTITDAYPISSISLTRTASKPFANKFYLFGSRSILQPRAHGDGYWMMDYDQLAYEAANTASAYVYTHSASEMRYRWVMMVAEDMSACPYRFILNEMKVTAASAVYASSHYLNSGTIADVAKKVLNAAYVPTASAFIDSGSTPTVSDYTTDTGTAGAILADLVDFGGCRFEVGRDSKATFKLDPFWSSASYIPPGLTESASWVNLNVTSVDGDWRNGFDVGRIELPWRDATNSASGTVYYPTLVNTLGENKKMKEYYASSSNAAYIRAQKLYWKGRCPYGVLVEANGAPRLHTAGEGCNVTLDLDSGNVVLDRTFLTQKAQHAIQKQSLASVFTIMQVGREDEL